ncbi:MAG TPA: extracellular solute-binding protein [Xanthobacteraceae bacterium]|jgi:iron(III) transport system substrate-binding protein|nr:extracellular solute-binding protein [Xanthobacteraceae bacterium]
MPKFQPRTVRVPRYLAALAMLIGMTSVAQTACAATIDEIAHLSGPDREKVLLEGARKEGKVTLYSAMIEDQALRPVAAAFRKKYPFLQMDFWRADSRDLINKTLAEARGRAVIGDLVEGGGVSQALRRAKVLQPFRSPMLAAYDKQLYDPEGYWAATRVSYFGLAYNTRLIKSEDVPQTYDDLLNPKYKGKLCWSGSGETGGETMFITFIRLIKGDEAADDYLRRLSEQHVITYMSSAREAVNKTMEGECGIALNIFLHHPIISARKGASVAPKPLDPVEMNASVVTLAKGSQHPHAAMLLIDYLLSREAQEILEGANYFPAHPDAEPSKMLASIIPSKIGMKTKFVSEEVLFKERTKSLALQKKYFGAR